MQIADHKCKAIIHYAAGTPVVFLHGFSYTSEVWQRIGATQLLKEKHIPFLALDMPYGEKSECQPKTHSDKKNVAVAREATINIFDGKVPVLVGASIGGHVALKYALEFPVQGLLLVAPSRALEEPLLEAYRKWTFPVRIIWGTEDNIISGEEMRTLVDKLQSAKLVTYQDAGHSAYISHQDRFKLDLMELYAAAEEK